MPRASTRRANDLTVQQLRSFCTVFEQQSYAAAARALGLSVPTVWEQVRVVEERYGTVFFEKKGRRIVPNASAAQLHQSLEPVLTGLDSTFTLVNEHEARRAVTLVVGMRMLFEDLQRPLALFQKEFPETTLRLLHGDLRSVQTMVTEEAADLAMTLEPAPSEIGGRVTAERAYQIDYLAVFPKRHALGKKPKLRLKDLVELPLILGHPGTSVRKAFDFAAHRERLTDRFEIVTETDNSAFTVSCVQAGLGIGIIAGRPESPLTRSLQVRSLGSDLGQAHVIFLSKRGKQLSPPIRRLMTLIQEESENNKKS